ncbi:MAG: glycine cleavage system protein GcvH [Magnetococcales bacterium]|nr:glycine cleavage system protein GcvH [Magnetococcales bacterium]NGZ27031.1 glycine cleavage system protein GcvH [Magnetococcales bacterium]
MGSATTNCPSDLSYTSEHEWVRRLDNHQVEVGITSYAVDQLGDVVFVDLPQVGATLQAGRPFGTVESVKSLSDLFAPVSGTVLEVNQELRIAPELVNEDPYGAGWMIRIQVSGENEPLLTAQEYLALLS